VYLKNQVSISLYRSKSTRRQKIVARQEDGHAPLLQIKKPGTARGEEERTTRPGKTGELY